VLLVLRVADRLQEVGVAPDPAAVLGRAGALARLPVEEAAEMAD
jgi:hypothetical protein